jgi:uncharacterized protein
MSFDLVASQRYDYRLMNNSTSGFIDPYKMAKHKQALEGKIAVASMSRANKLLDSEQGEVEYKLLFDIDQDKICYIAGEFESDLKMRCQRCLQVFSQKITGSFKVSPLKADEDAKDLPDPYEPVLVVDGKIFPAELVEDELILALPIVPMHTEDCVGKKLQDLEAPANPFKILQTLKVDVKKKGQQAEDE